MSREYDGVRTTTTKGGATLSNASYTRGNTFWSSSYAWELTTGDHEQGEEAIIEMMRTLGRRAWNLKFSYISDKDLFASNYMQTTHLETSTGYDAADVDADRTVFNYTVDSDNSFMSLVWQKTLGGALPFIFQPLIVIQINSASQGLTRSH